MKLSKIALAVAATLVAGQALALTPAEVATARGASTLKEVWISGNSAIAHNRYLSIVSTVCDSTQGSIHRYTNGANNKNPGSAGNYEAYACVDINGNPTAIYDQFAGGSFTAFITAMGVPAPTGVSLPLQRIGNLDSVTGCTVGTATPEGIPTYYGCALTSSTAWPTTGVTRPDGGFSDVESALFKNLLQNKNASDYGTESSTVVGQVFGVAVSVPLYRAMQTAQGITSTACTDGVGTDDFEGACMPNITSAQYASIAALSGSYHQSWKSVVPGSTKDVYLERRVDSSGTQATSNANFLRNPCNGDPAATGSLDPADTTLNHFHVALNSGTGNVKTNLTNETNAGNYGIGIMSMENNWRSDAAASAGYRFVKLDGINPEEGDLVDARLSATTGNYKLVSEMVEFTANDATHNADHANATGIIDTIAANLGSPAACADVGRGMYLTPDSGATFGTSCVSIATREGKNCQNLKLVK